MTFSLNKKAKESHGSAGDYSPAGLMTWIPA